MTFRLLPKYEPNPNLEEFQKKLEHLINQLSMENGSNTPDYVLARYLVDCLIAFERGTFHRDIHYDT